MKIFKKLSIMFLITILAVGFLAGSTNAAVTYTLGASQSQVTVESNVSITISFSEKVDTAQFRLSYDTSKFAFVSVSKGDYSTSNKSYVYMNNANVADLGSVTFTFKATSVGNGAFSVDSGRLGVPSSDTKITMANKSVAVTVAAKQETQTTPSTQQTKPSNQGTTKPSNSSNTNKPQTQEQPKKEEPVVENIDKSELESLKKQLEGKIETDYTAESWKTLQDIIARAESATTTEQYNNAKSEFNLDKLVPAEFERTELYDLLFNVIELKSEDYTDSSWKELQETVMSAKDVKLKSEYDAIKDKLTLDNLKKKNEAALSLLEIILIVVVVVLLIAVIFAVIKYRILNNEYKAMQLKKVLKSRKVK